MPSTAPAFLSYLHTCQERVNHALEQCLPTAAAPAEKLKSAMRYSVQNGGKRVRATLVYASADALGCCQKEDCPNKTPLDHAACAVELIHAYSLIHDDLPAMDNDNLRRGKPTCHIAFGEATAILAGDALQTMAFELLSRCTLPPDVALDLVRSLAVASGVAGMVGGQQLDMDAENQQLSLNELEQVHRLKTGALIRASVRLGARIARADDTALQSLDRYATAVGLAFQVMDDILDVESDTVTLGKTSGSDAAQNKATYPALLGLAGARRKAQDLHQEALAAVDALGPAADPLRQLSHFVVSRNR